MKASIFIVDDHYMVIEGIHSLLHREENIECMGHTTTAKISEKLFISMPAVTTHRQSLLEKFDVKNTIHAVKLPNSYTKKYQNFNVCSSSIQQYPFLP